MHEILGSVLGKSARGPMQSELATNTLSIGTGVFNSDGERWKFHRSMTRPFFSKERIVDFETFGRHSGSAVALIKERCATGEPIDLQV